MKNGSKKVFSLFLSSLYGLTAVSFAASGTSCSEPDWLPYYYKENEGYNVFENNNRHEHRRHRHYHSHSRDYDDRHDHSDHKHSGPSDPPTTPPPFPIPDHIKNRISN